MWKPFVSSLGSLPRVNISSNECVYGRNSLRVPSQQVLTGYFGPRILCISLGCSVVDGVMRCREGSSMLKKPSQHRRRSGSTVAAALVLAACLGKGTCSSQGYPIPDSSPQRPGQTVRLSPGISRRTQPSVEPVTRYPQTEKSGGKSHIASPMYSQWQRRPDASRACRFPCVTLCPKPSIKN